jgi:uncharacterized protein (TIGR02145 family)
LNSLTGNKGGLLLSNVMIMDLRTIPDEISEADAINPDATKKTQFTGAMVYHTGSNDIAAGVYIWNGRKWIPAGGCRTCPEGMVMDEECNCYTTCDFGTAAGTWMTENLRTMVYTYPANGTAIPLVEKSTTAGSTTDPEYTYPRVVEDWAAVSEADRDSVFRAHEHYGLLYNWPAASGRTDAPAEADANGIGMTAGTTDYRGICPSGWHLPNDYEWILLEMEIATNPQDYSNQTEAYSGEGNYTSMTIWRPVDEGTDPEYWGRQMKSTTAVNDVATDGSSNSCTAGGFDALLVGYESGTGGVVMGYGTMTGFWSSSSNSNSGIYRRLFNEYSGVYRDDATWSNLYSVRCKKD